MFKVAEDFKLDVQNLKFHVCVGFGSVFFCCFPVKWWWLKAHGVHTRLHQWLHRKKAFIFCQALCFKKAKLVSFKSFGCCVFKRKWSVLYPLYQVYCTSKKANEQLCLCWKRQRINAECSGMVFDEEIGSSCNCFV